MTLPAERGTWRRAARRWRSCPRCPAVRDTARAPRRTRHPSPLGVGSAVNCLRTTTLEPDFGFLPITRMMTRCWPGSVDSAHAPGVMVFSQDTVSGPRLARLRHHSLYRDNPGHAQDRACRSGVLDSGAARHGGLRCYSCRCSAHCGGKAPIAPPAGHWPEAPGHEPLPRQKSGWKRATYFRSGAHWRRHCPCRRDHRCRRASRPPSRCRPRRVTGPPSFLPAARPRTTSPSRTAWPPGSATCRSCTN